MFDRICVCFISVASLTNKEFTLNPFSGFKRRCVVGVFPHLPDDQAVPRIFHNKKGAPDQRPGLLLQGYSNPRLPFQFVPNRLCVVDRLGIVVPLVTRPRTFDGHVTRIAGVVHG